MQELDRERAFRAAILNDFKRRDRAFPWRRTDDAFAVLVGEILLQRTRGENVEPVYREVLRRWPTPLRMSRARVSTIERVIAPLGLVRRAATLHQLARELAVLGSVPTQPVDLEQLPGVGPYAAHAIPVFVYGANLPVVDWVIARVLRRYFGLPGGLRPNHDNGLWDLSRRLAAPGEARALWLGTLDLAASICRPRPKCELCPLAGRCLHARATG